MENPTRCAKKIDELEYETIDIKIEKSNIAEMTDTTPCLKKILLTRCVKVILSGKRSKNNLLFF